MIVPCNGDLAHVETVLVEVFVRGIVAEFPVQLMRYNMKGTRDQNVQS